MSHIEAAHQTAPQAVGGKDKGGVSGGGTTNGEYTDQLNEKYMAYTHPPRLKTLTAHVGIKGDCENGVHNDVGCVISLGEVMCMTSTVTYMWWGRWGCGGAQTNDGNRFPHMWAYRGTCVAVPARVVGRWEGW